MLHRRENSGDGSQRRYVRASDRRLAEVVAQASRRIDWDDLRRRHSKVADVTTETQLDGTLVTATCIIECSIAEITALVNPPTSQHYVCAMRELIGRDFIYGAIVHHAKEITTQDVTVKTVTLMKRHLLARSEQWCFVSSVKALEPSASPIQADAPDAEPASAMIARVLSDVLGSATSEEKPVVIRVIKHLLSPKVRVESKFRADPIDLARSLGHLVQEEKLPEPLAEEETNQATEASLEDGETPPLAGATGRLYPLRYQDVSDNAEPADLPSHPVPTDESRRLGWIDSHPSIVCHMMDLPELQLLCDVARGELRCDATLVTIIGPDASYVVASTDAGWRGCSIPRDHSICAHTLMSKEPLLVPHPEADVRFSAMNLVRRDGVRFYFGFPILISYPEGDTTAVGTFCCVHAGQSRNVSESQYALMTTLAEGATRVMESHASLLLK
ncbi:hypothetical protein BBO99_00004557 [Phytophthora kernoviae]|uniref:GAF domain-containing protein n=2 Tax=Phytophthora kernoviae TaxID=325452 RepID=A0A421GR88_9STRA|nr:hypothetical protein G195_004978 [Phytophthora kernoviae 00238/432]KAG2527438.1 hypothetical protein JM18_003862 [Phytophthora kernoviae]RLN38244.1 hypothetical protein BBI17_004744 [Phytophthora kernoviae]RLN80344.1 hypothetical protein BBO99_00004557 [Phytophthora kernoviae]